MADSTPNIQLSGGVWSNLYALSGIAVGTQVVVTNVGNSECQFYMGV